MLATQLMLEGASFQLRQIGTSVWLQYTKRYAISGNVSISDSTLIIFQNQNSQRSLSMVRCLRYATDAYNPNTRTF
jgi:hypothetical protein